MLQMHWKSSACWGMSEFLLGKQAMTYFWKESGRNRTRNRRLHTRSVVWAAVAVGCTWAVATASASLSVYEPFNYTSAAQVSGQSGGGSFGFSAAWTGGSSTATVGTGSLVGYSTVGNRAAMAANSLTTPLSRTLTSTMGTSAGTTYFSFLLRPEATVGTSSAELRLTGSAASVGFGLNSNSGAYLIDQVGGTQTTSSSIASVNSPVLLVLKAVFGAGSAADTFSLFYNPLVGSTEGAANATKTFDVGTVSALSIAGNLAFSVDEIKVGSSYADVVPEASTNVAIGAVSLLVAGRWFAWKRRQNRLVTSTAPISQ